MMNMGRWDEAREHLLRARKLAPKADYVIYAMAALDCLTGEAESAMENLKLAIQLRPENRYHARNDEDFAFSKKTLDLRSSFTRIATAQERNGVRHVNRSKPHRVRPMRIVAIGGGTGLSTLLRGLKTHVAPRQRRNSQHPISDLAAIVTVMDDGGSSGRLRREYSVLPRVTFAIAWSLCQKTKPCSAVFFNIASSPALA